MSLISQFFEGIAHFTVMGAGIYLLWMPYLVPTQFQESIFLFSPSKILNSVFFWVHDGFIETCSLTSNPYLCKIPNLEPNSAYSEITVLACRICLTKNKFEPLFGVENRRKASSYICLPLHLLLFLSSYYIILYIVSQ